MNKQIAVIRVRGKTGIKSDIKDAMNNIRLYNKHHCVILEENKYAHGILNKIKDYVTWGELNESTMKELLSKRAKLPGNQPLTEEYLKQKLKVTFDELSKDIMGSKKKIKDVPGIKQFFRLKPPEGGFERGGIKKPFSMGGSLGYRSDKINVLIKKMM